jgi:branched-subunit amino acid transport protein
MTLWLIIIAIGVLTFATRLSLILAWERITVPPRVQRALRFVPVAVLSAIILPALLLQNNTPALTLHNTRLLAGALAVVVAWTTRNALLTIVAGMGALWLLQFVLR